MSYLRIDKLPRGVRPIGAPYAYSSGARVAQEFTKKGRRFIALRWPGALNFHEFFEVKTPREDAKREKVQPLPWG